jgi:RNA polymerase-binding transcription factor DksA
VNADRARELLTAELAELDDRARFADEGRAEGADADSEGPLSQHPADYGSDVAGAMDAELLIDTVATQRRSVQEALGRLDDGSFGRCMVCDKAIDDERLQARPEVPTCREHADTPVGA